MVENEKLSKIQEVVHLHVYRSRRQLLRLLRERQMRGRKGTLDTLMVAMIALFFLGVLYFAITPAFYKINDAFNASYVADSRDAYVLERQQDSIHKLGTVWDWWPMIVVLGIILYLILNSIRRQPFNYYEGGGGIY